MVFKLSTRISHTGFGYSVGWDGCHGKQCGGGALSWQLSHLELLTTWMLYQGCVGTSIPTTITSFLLILCSFRLHQVFCLQWRPVPLGPGNGWPLALPSLCCSCFTGQSLMGQMDLVILPHVILFPVTITADLSSSTIIGGLTLLTCKWLPLTWCACSFGQLGKFTFASFGRLCCSGVEHPLANLEEKEAFFCASFWPRSQQFPLASGRENTW